MALNFRSLSSRPVWLILFFLSGAASLGYQTVWTKMFANGLGHEVPAMLSVVCAFMTGMALGAWILSRRIGNAARQYAFLEVVIGIWGIASCWLIPAGNEITLGLLGPNPATGLHWTTAFTSTLLTILPATAAMGATFAAMERLLAGHFAEGRVIGALYASNTFGAVLGVLGGTFVLMPQLGLKATALSLAGANFFCALLAWRIGAASPQAQAVVSHSKPKLSTLRLRTTVVAMGLLGIGMEVVGIRVLSQVLENTVFTFAVVLAIYLLGTALGAAAHQIFGRRVSLWWLLWAASLSCLGSIIGLSNVQAIHDVLRNSLPDSLMSGTSVELLCAAAVFLFPTVVFGALFSELFQMAKASGASLGSAYALNCIGSAVAPVVFSTALLPGLGAKGTLAIIAVAYLGLLPILPGKRWLALAFPLTLFFFLPTELRVVSVPPGGSLLEYAEGRLASVAVVQDALGERTLRVNNRFQMGGTSAHQAEYRQAHFPLLLHPQPRRALFLGVGTGITMAAAELYPGLDVEGVELVPEVEHMMPHFAPYNELSGTLPRVLVADARRFVRAASERYDVIVADLFHPSRDGAGTLYTREHFSAIREHLSPDGLFCQWLPLHQMDERMLRLVIRTFLAVFPNTQAYLLHFNVEVPVLGLIGFAGTPRLSDQWLERKEIAPALQAQLKKLALADSLRFFGHFVGGPDFLGTYAADGPLNTDDRQQLTFGAPAFSFRKGLSPYGRLWPWLRSGEQAAVELRLPGDSSRLAKFIDARNTFLRGLAAESDGHEALAIDHFIESARISEDFTAGYSQCLSKASVWIREQPEKARELLQRLAEAQPSRTIAHDMLIRMKPGNP